MDTFFAQFPGFQHVRTNAPEHEFDRLQTHRRWKAGAKAHKRYRREFLSALAACARSPVHNFFIITYPFPAYDPTAHPRHEFARLAEFKKWSPTAEDYSLAEEAFNKAFQLEFGSCIVDFFEDHEEAGFEYNPRGKMEEELHRMAKHFDWKPRSSEWLTAKAAFLEAISEDFNMTFGRNDEDIIGWQFLLEVLGVPGPKPGTAEECREAVKHINVNIYDVLNYVRDGCPAHVTLQFFSSVGELADYSYYSVPKKVYPSRIAWGSLQFVLRPLGSSRTGSKKPGQAPGKGKKKKKRSKATKEVGAEPGVAGVSLTEPAGGATAPSPNIEELASAVSAMVVAV